MCLDGCKLRQTASEIDTLRAQLEAAQADAARMREAVEDAAYEWAKYVEVDTAPRTLLEHMRNAIDAARAALEGGK